jgi:hypothetical protein
MSNDPYDPYQQQPQQSFPPQPYSPGPASQPYPPPQQYSPQPYQPAPQFHGHYRHQPAFHGHYRARPQFGYRHPTAPASGWATASLVMGIIGLLSGWCLAGLPCIGAIIAGHIGLAQTRNGDHVGRGLAIGGLTLGYVAVVPSVLMFILTVVGWLTGPPA